MIFLKYDQGGHDHKEASAGLQQLLEVEVNAEHHRKLLPTPLFLPSAARRFPRGHQILHVPQPICDARRHRWTHSQRPMNLDEIERGAGKMLALLI